MTALADEFSEWFLNNDGTPKLAEDISITLDQSLWLNAVHEAAHAVVGMTYGMSLREIGVVFWSEGSTWSATGLTRWHDGPANAHGYAVMCAAGTRAQIRQLHADRLGSPELLRAAENTDDREVAEHVCREVYPIRDDHDGNGAGTTWAQIERDADRVNHSLWDAIQTLAGELSMRPNQPMSGAEVAALLGIVNPEAGIGGAR